MKNNARYRPCPICGSDQTSLLSPATSDVPYSPKQIQASEKFFGLHGDIVRCNQCSFHYIGNQTYVEKTIGLYKSMSDEAYVQEERERRRSFERVIRHIEHLRCGKKGALLDIGCCTGGLLVQAQSRGWNVFGLDLSQWACTIAKKLHGLTIHNGTLETYSRKKERFDAITLLDVLEHVEDPVALMEQAHQKLAADGMFCIVTPDYGSLAARLLGKRWWGIRLAHLSYFTINDIRRLAEMAGFHIRTHRTYVRYFSLYYIFVRLFPFIEKNPWMKGAMKRLVVPLYLFDTFELYLVKRPSI